MAYQPSVWRVNKYMKYLQYHLEYLSRADFKSIYDSIKYVVFHVLPEKGRHIKTNMGKFYLRQSTTDFQFVNMTYEYKVKKYLSKNINEIGLFIDVGACIGEYCVWLNKKGIQCLAIEPVNWEVIMLNSYLNNTTFPILNYAAGDKEKTVEFAVEKNVTSSSRMISSSKNNGDSVSVEMKRIDNMIRHKDVKIPSDKLIVMKLDIEGMEPEALKGAEQFIKSTKNLHIIYEYYDDQDAKIKSVLNSFCEFEYTDLDGVNMLAVRV